MILSKKWVEKSAVVIFLRPIPAITNLIIENQIAMDSDLSSRVLEYLEELGYKKPSKG